MVIRSSGHVGRCCGRPCGRLRGPEVVRNDGSMVVEMVPLKGGIGSIFHPRRQGL